MVHGLVREGVGTRDYITSERCIVCVCRLVTTMMAVRAVFCHRQSIGCTSNKCRCNVVKSSVVYSCLDLSRPHIPPTHMHMHVCI